MTNYRAQPYRYGVAMNRGSWSWLAVVCGLSLAACGGGGPDEPVDPIEISTASIDPGSPISLDIPVDEDTGAFAYDQWPSACDLVDKATVESIFPQAEGVRQSGSDKQLKFLSIGGNTPASPVTVPDADCVTTVGFPQPGLGLSDGNVVVNIRSAVAVAGSEEFVDRNTKANMSGEPTDVGDGACQFLTGTYSCDTGSVIFSVNLDMRRTAQYTKAKSSDYVVDGEEFSFTGQDDRFDTIAHDQVLQPLVEAALARLQ